MKTTKLFALIFLGAALIFSSCEKTEELTNIEITTITGNTTFFGDKTYVINQEVYIDNAELVIQPGCVLRFGPEGRITVGYTGNAAIIAIGTADKPITFKNASAGSTWYGLWFASYATNRNILKNCRFEGAGKSSYFSSVIAIVGSKISMVQCQILNSANYGIFCDADAGFVRFDSNTVSNCGLHLLRIEAKFVPTIGLFNTFNTTGNYGIEVSGQYLESGNTVTWKKQTLPYYIIGDVEVENNTEWVIEAGTVFKMATEGTIWIGYMSNARIVAQGTIAEPVVFTSAAINPTHGNWRGITFGAYTMANSKLEHCQLLYGGYGENGSLIRFDGTENVDKVTVKDCRIAYSSHYGVYFSWGTDWTSVSTGNTYDNNLDGNIYREE